MFQTNYTTYLADLRRYLLTQCSSSNRFFSMDAKRSAWEVGVQQTNTLEKAVWNTPSSQPVCQPAKPCKAPLPIPVVDVPKDMPVPVPSVAPVTVASVTVAPVVTALPQQELVKNITPSPHRLTLQPPPAPEPFAAEEWKQRFVQLTLKLKTHDTPPLPFGEQLWGVKETDYVVLFIEVGELSARTQQFVQSMQHAAKWLLSPIGCLPMQELSSWSATLSSHVTAMPLRDLELYLKEPLRKKMLWNELERLYHVFRQVGRPS